jgi:hypothetical protein
MARKNAVSAVLSDEELVSLRRIPAPSDAERIRILIQNAQLTAEIARAVGQELRPEIRLSLVGMKEAVERERLATRELIANLTRQIEKILKGGSNAVSRDTGERDGRTGLL